MELELLETVQDHLPKGFVPYSIYCMMVNHQEVGRLVLRHGNDEQCYIEGHIGYTVEPEFRGHGYAYEACMLLKNQIDNDELYMTCDPNNIPSLKTIEKLGCLYIETKAIPSHMRKFFSQDEKEKMIFKWKIERRTK